MEKTTSNAEAQRAQRLAEKFIELMTSSAILHALCASALEFKDFRVNYVE